MERSLQPATQAPLITGELKRNKSFFSSEKNVYRLVYPHLQIKAGSKGQFEPKYDLRLYKIRLSKANKTVFYLEPGASAQVQKLEFEAKTVEERAQWYLALQKCMETSEQKPLSEA